MIEKYNFFLHFSPLLLAVIVPLSSNFSYIWMALAMEFGLFLSSFALVVSAELYLLWLLVSSEKIENQKLEQIWFR